MSADRIAAALRPLAPDGKLLSEDVVLIDKLAGNWAARPGRKVLSLRHPTALKRPADFYALLRQSLFREGLRQSQVDGTEALLSAMGKAGWPIAWAAYALATAWHETAFTMQPIKERGGAAYFRKHYDIEGERPDKAKRLGNVMPGDGARFAGRGFVQLTGRDNYARAAGAVGVDLIADPDRAMDCAIACQILVSGMASGWFTGKGLADYLPRTGQAAPAQFVNARRIINGTDRAAEIAAYASTFQAALQEGGWA